MAAAKKTEISDVSLDLIRIDGETQCRAELDDISVKEYAELLIGEFELPPVTVYFDGSDYWLSDGFHRFHAYRSAHFDSIPCDVRQGSCQDAQWAACGANQAHGLRRTNADKARAVEMALRHPQGAKLSNVAISDHVGVSKDTVAKYRAELESTCEISRSSQRVGQDGRVRRTGSQSRSEGAKNESQGEEQERPDRGQPVECLPEEPPFDVVEGEGPQDQRKPVESSKSTQLLDGLKRPVPLQFAEVFADLSVFDDLRRRLNDLRTDFQLLCGSKQGIFLHWQRVAADIDNLKAALKFAKPFTVCPYCNGNGCKACKHQGWCPQDVQRSAPPEMQRDKGAA